MRKRQGVEGFKAAERYSKAAAVLPNADIKTRRLGIAGAAGSKD